MNLFFNPRTIFLAVFLLLLASATIFAQNGAFTYQGRLADNAPQGGSYLLKFELYDAAADGTLVDALTDIPVTVVNGVFTVELNFTAANAFDGTERFLQISVRRSGSESYVALNPRQKITSTPYAVRALTATNALQIGGTPESQIIREGDTRLSDARLPLAGSTDYIQNQFTTPQASTSFNIAGNGRVGGIFTGDVVNSLTQYNIGGSRVLFTGLNGVTFAGINAGNNNTSGAFISFFGEAAGRNNTQGTHNSFFGSYSGSNNTTGVNNSFFGADAGFSNQTGIGNSFFGFRAGFNNAASDNSFFGLAAGEQNTSGLQNVFIGRQAGAGNTTGSNNTFLGFSARPTATNLNFAAAIGSGATVSTSNTIVLGRSGGEDRVLIPGTLSVANFSAATVNAGTQFNLNNARILAAGNQNTFLGYFTGAGNTSGQGNSFFGQGSGSLNISGNLNSFFGWNSGALNTIGSDNSFFGKDSGINNQSGSRNTFIGTISGYSNAAGSNNTALGFNTNVADNLTFATAIGSEAQVSTSSTIVLGRNNGADTVQIPGVLNVAAQYNLGGNRFLSAPSSNTFVGVQTGTANTSGTRNAFFGSFAGTSNTAGSDNSFFGRESGNRNTTGSDNSFFGLAAGYSNTSGTRNSYFGSNAGRSSQEAISNSFFGTNAGANTVNTGYNSFFGDNAGYYNIGERNVFVGFYAGFGNQAGSFNTLLGSDADVSVNNLTYATAIGAGTRVGTNNTVVLGRSADRVLIPGTLFVQNVPSGDRRNLQWDADTGQFFQDTSSRRYKENIRPLATNFRALLGAVPQTYTRPGAPNRWEIGFIAEELDALGLTPLVEYDASGRPDGVKYDKIPLYLTQIAAEQQTEITRLGEENERLKARLDAQQAELDALKKLVCAMQPQAAACAEQKP
jgi:hypothetical protein